MQLHELKPKHRLKKKKRVGRGGKKGTYSGRGIKGQRARAGRAPRPALRDIVKKFHKKRGYRFNPIKKKPVVFNLSLLAQTFHDQDIITIKALHQKRLLRKRDKIVKILGKGELKIKLFFEGRKDLLKFSHAALEKIKKAGGKVRLTAKKRPTLPKAEREKLKGTGERKTSSKQAGKNQTKSGKEQRGQTKKPAKQVDARKKVSIPKNLERSTEALKVSPKKSKKTKETHQRSVKKNPKTKAEKEKKK